MSFWKSDYNGSDDHDEPRKGKSRNVANAKGLFRLRLPYGMENGRDILYLDDNPFRFWEHCGKDDEGHWNIFGVCRRKNRIGEDCPPCDKKGINLYNIGFFTVIDISFAVGKEFKGERRMYLCEKRLLGAKRGSQEYPGALADIHRIREREGRLRGLVIHQIRKGKRSPNVGDSFEVIEKLEQTPEAMLKYLKTAVRKMWDKGVIKTACDKAGVPTPGGKWFEERFAAIDFNPAPYEELFKPMDAVELANLYGLSHNSQQASGGNGSSGDPFGYDDDDPAVGGSNTKGSHDSEEDMPF